MIQGRLDGSVGRIYMYYHGPMRAVLSDVSLQPVLGSKGDGIATGLRIVLLPNEWTEVNFSDVKEKWDTGNSQLNHLEASGYLDIYTDIEEVKKAKELLKDFHLPENLKHGQYIKAFEDKDVIKKYMEQKKSNEPVKESAPKKQYFDLAKAGDALKGEVSTEDINTVTKETESFERVVKLVEQQVAQSTKQAEQMNKMMETMQQMLVAMASNLKKD